MNRSFSPISRKKAIGYYFYLVVFCAVTAFLFWKCRYGFGNTDESFLITIPYRLIQGDKLCYNEWHLSQTSSVFLIPAVWLHLTLFGNTDGIILFLRYIFTMVWSAGALFFFFRLKRFSGIGAALASFAFLLYTPYGVMALSYNSMGILFLLASTVIVVTAEKKRAFQYFAAGVFYSAAVLCCPFLAALYLVCSLGLAAVIVLNRYVKPIGIKNRLQQIWRFETLGILLSASAYLWYIFSHISMKQLFDVIPHMLNDPEHSSLSLYAKTRYFVNNTFSQIGGFVILSALIFVIVKLKKNWRKPCLIAMYLIISCNVIESLIVDNYMNHIMVPLNIFGIYCALNDRGEARDRLFYGIYIPGILYSYCANYSSNQIYFAISSASAVSTIASVMLIVLYTQKVFREPTVRVLRLRVRAAWILIALMMAVQLGAEAYLRYYKVFWEKSIYTQTERIDFGPEKGIIASKEKREEYSGFYEDISSFKDNKNLNVLFLSKKTWLYLCTSNHSSTYSAWIAGVNDHSIKRLDRYYEICQDKIPDLVFVEAGYEQYIPHYATNEDSITKTSNGNYIIDLRSHPTKERTEITDRKKEP